MNRRRPRLTIHIDRITSDRPGIDREALSAALRQELGQVLTEHGAGELGPSSTRPKVQSSLAPGDGSLTTRLARTVTKVVRS